MFLPVLARAGAAVDGEGEGGALAQGAHDLGQHRVAACLGQPLVEFGVEPRKLLGRAGLGGGVAAPQRILQERRRSRDRGGARPAGRSVLPERADLDQFGDQLGRDLGDVAPRRGSSRTKPSTESPRSASRTGTRDTPSSAESLSSTRRSPGLSLPSRIWPRIWSLTILLREARSVATGPTSSSVAMKAAIPASQQAMSCSPLPPEAAMPSRRTGRRRRSGSRRRTP